MIVDGPVGGPEAPFVDRQPPVLVQSHDVEGVDSQYGPDVLKRLRLPAKAATDGSSEAARRGLVRVSTDDTTKKFDRYFQAPPASGQLGAGELGRPAPRAGPGRLAQGLVGLVEAARRPQGQAQPVQGLAIVGIGISRVRVATAAPKQSTASWCSPR